MKEWDGGGFLEEVMPENHETLMRPWAGVRQDKGVIKKQRLEGKAGRVLRQKVQQGQRPKVRSSLVYQERTSQLELREPKG